MPRKDYGSVPACENGDVGTLYVLRKYLDSTHFEVGTLKWIPITETNARLPYTKGAKALVGVEFATKCWRISLVKEPAFTKTEAARFLHDLKRH